MKRLKKSSRIEYYVADGDMSATPELNMVYTEEYDRNGILVKEHTTSERIYRNGVLEIETIKEYPIEGDYESVVWTENRYDLNLVEVTKSVFEYWD